MQADEPRPGFSPRPIRSSADKARVIAIRVPARLDFDKGQADVPIFMGLLECMFNDPVVRFRFRQFGREMVGLTRHLLFVDKGGVVQ